jgi:hypothetical protein
MAHDHETTRPIGVTVGRLLPARAEPAAAWRYDDQPRVSGPSSRGAAGMLAGTFLTVALIVQGLVGFAYERFYAALAVDPKDVGIGAAMAIMHSIAFTVVVALVVTLSALVVRSITAFLGRRLAADGRGAWNFHNRSFAVLVGLYFTVALIVVYGGLALSQKVVSYSTKAATVARSGGAVRPLQIYGLPLVATHADPVGIQPTGKARTLPGIWDLHDHQLLYLGQDRDTAVVYDATRRQAVHVPMAMMVLHVENCTAKAPQPACRGGLT